MVIKAVIFDCFGVLTQDGWLSFCQKYMTDDNREELRYINHQADRGVIDYDTFLDTVCRLTGAPREEAHAEITTMHSPNEPLFELIRRLKEEGYVLGAISNVGSNLNNFLPQNYVDLFDEITLSYHVHAIKPEPEIYEHHLNNIGFQADECVFVDDRKPNVVGAEAVGMHGLYFTDAESLKADLAKLGIA